MEHFGFEEEVLTIGSTIELQRVLEEKEAMTCVTEYIAPLLQLGSPYILRPHKLVKHERQYSIHYYRPKGSVLLSDLVTEYRAQHMEIAEELLWRIFYCLLHAIQHLELTEILTIQLISQQSVLLLENGIVQISIPHAIGLSTLYLNKSPSEQLMDLHACINDLVEHNAFVTRRCRLGVEQDEFDLLDRNSTQEGASIEKRIINSAMRARTPVNMIRFSTEISLSVRRATSRPARSSLKASTNATLCISTLRYVLSLMNSPSFNVVMTAETLLNTPNIRKLMEPIKQSYTQKLDTSKCFLCPLIESMLVGDIWFSENMPYLLHFAGRVDRVGRTALIHLASQSVGSLYPSLREHSLVTVTSEGYASSSAYNQRIVGFLIDYENSYIDSNGGCASCYALASGNLGLFSMLKEKEAHRYKASGITPLVLTISHKPEDSPDLSLLLSHADRKLISGHTCLMLAAVYNASAWVPHLIDQKNVYLADGTSALMLAADRGHTAIVKMLAPHEIKHRDKNGNTALLRLLKSCLTCLKPSSDLWKELGLEKRHKILQDIVSILASGESDVVDSKGIFPIDYAIELNDEEIVQILAMHPYPKRLPGQRTRMMNACINSNYALTCALYRSEVGITDDDGRTALMHLSRSPETTEGLRCAQLLLQSEVSLRDKEGKTALIHACICGNIEQVKLLYRYECGLLYIDTETHEELTELQLIQRVCVSEQILNYISGNAPVPRDTLERTPLMKYAIYASRKMRGTKSTDCEVDETSIQSPELSLGYKSFYTSMSINELHKLVDAQAGMRDKNGKTALMYCAQYNNVNLAKLLVWKELYLRTISGETALMHCSKEPLISHKILEHLVKESGIFDVQGRTALMHAIHCGNIKLANALIEREAGAVDVSGHCALHYSVFNKKLNLISTKLIPAEGHITDKYGHTSFMIACQAGNEKIAELLFKPEYLGVKDSRGWTALMYCCHFKMEHLIEMTLDDAGTTISRTQCIFPRDYCFRHKTFTVIDKECLTALHLYIQAQGCCENTLSALYIKERTISTASGKSPLHLAISVRNTVAAEALSRYEIDRGDIYDNKGNTPLMAAVLVQDISTIELLAPYFCGLKNKKNGKSALFMAIDNCYEEGCGVLCQYEARILNKQGKYPLYIAIEKKQKNIAQLLLPWNAGLISPSGHYALYASLTNGMTDISVQLIKQEEKYLPLDNVSRLMIAAATHENIEPYMDCVGKQDKNGYTALIYAILCANKEAAQALLEKESDLMDKTGRTALMYAAQYGMNEVITSPHLSMCLQKQTQKGWTALMWAVASGNTKGVELLKTAEARLTTVDGETALMLAARSGQERAVETLAPLEGGVYVTALSSLQRGFTALHFAATGGHKECVKILLELTQEAYIRTFARKTAAEWARTYNFPACAELIEKAVSSARTSEELMDPKGPRRV
ncbi:Protein 21.1 [Giardia lamblia P15]|uniref:Protein 21.1 n=1 Tax=Giardia intestinalis (strain P15) TaxID=658858 RepID=E1EVV3_GIAIA|nr:Protein 21.1 [Giardia lamblia P15]